MKLTGKTVQESTNSSFVEFELESVDDSVKKTIEDERTSSEMIWIGKSDSLKDSKVILLAMDDIEENDMELLRNNLDDDSMEVIDHVKYDFERTRF
jgi:hypothetical protein